MTISRLYLILRTVLGATLAITLSQNVYADLSIDDFQKFARKGSTEQKKSIEMYIGGVGKGYMWANVALGKTKQQLFCTDDDMTTKDFYDMALEAIKLQKKDNDADTPVELVLLLHLKKLYPCK